MALSKDSEVGRADEAVLVGARCFVPQRGDSFALWTRRAVADLICQQYGIDLPVRTVGEYLRRWGSTAKVPRPQAKDQDSEEVRQWLEETYPAIERRAARAGVEIHWCDETGAAADQQPRRGYAREGQPARIDVPDPS